MWLNLSATELNSCRLYAKLVAPLRNASNVSLLIPSRPASGAARLSILIISCMSFLTSPVFTLPAGPAVEFVEFVEPAEELIEVSVDEFPDRSFQRKNIAMATNSTVRYHISSLIGCGVRIKRYLNILYTYWERP